MRYCENAVIVGLHGRDNRLQFSFFDDVVFAERFYEDRHFRTAHRYVIDEQVDL